MNESIITMITDEQGVCNVYVKPNMLFIHGSEEMMRIENDGFYVRGVKVNQDDHEAETVYKAFHAWLSWSTLYN